MTTPAPIPGARPVLCVMSDLMFRSRIDDVTTRLGLPLRAAKNMEQLERHLANGLPAFVFLDLECDSIDPLAVIARLRQVPKGVTVPIVAYAGHTNVAALRSAREAGVDEALPRSQFTADLSMILAVVAEGERMNGAAGA